MTWALGGMSLSTPRSTAELPTCPATAGNGALATAEPISHAISRTEMTLTTAPSTASTTVAGRHVTRDCIAAPTRDATNCPIMAARKTTMMATSACLAAPLTTARAMAGEKMAPTAAPPRKPTKLSTPTMKPCR